VIDDAVHADERRTRSGRSEFVAAARHRWSTQSVKTSSRWGSAPPHPYRTLRRRLHGIAPGQCRARAPNRSSATRSTAARRAVGNGREADGLRPSSARLGRRAGGRLACPATEVAGLRLSRRPVVRYQGTTFFRRYFDVRVDD
jgi:hypothetical protein